MFSKSIKSIKLPRFSLIQSNHSYLISSGTINTAIVRCFNQSIVQTQKKGKAFKETLTTKKLRSKIEQEGKNNGDEEVGEPESESSIPMEDLYEPKEMNRQEMIAYVLSKLESYVKLFLSVSPSHLPNAEDRIERSMDLFYGYQEFTETYDELFSLFRQSTKSAENDVLKKMEQYIGQSSNELLRAIKPIMLGCFFSIYISKEKESMKYFEQFFKEEIQNNETAKKIEYIGALFYGLSCQRFEKYERSKKYYEKAIALNPEFHIAYVQKSFTEIALQNENEADILFEKGINMCPLIASDSYLSRALFCQSLHKNDELVSKYFNESIKYDETNYEAYLMRAKYLTLKKKYKEAIKDLNKCIEIDDEAVAALEARAQIHELYLNDPVKALEDLNKWIFKSPLTSRAFAKRGMIMHEYFGKPDESLEDYNQALKLNKDETEAYYGRALVHQYVKKDFEKARKDFEAALNLDPYNIQYLNDYVKLLLSSTGQNKDQYINQAEMVLKKALEIAPDFSITWNNLAILYMAQNKTDKILDALNNSIKFNPNDISTYFDRSIVYSEILNEPERAVQDLDIILRKNPQHMDAMMAKGVIFVENLDRKEEGQKLIKRANEIKRMKQEEISKKQAKQ